MKIRVFFILIAIVITYFTLSYEKSKSYDSGFLYWSHPTLLREHWELVLTGTVLSVGKMEPINDEIPLASGHRRSGSIEVHEVLYQDTNDIIGQKELDVFDADVVHISGGFSGLKVGEKVLLFFTIYEGAYNMANFHGTKTKLGIKLKEFDDAIVNSSKNFFSATTQKEELKNLLKDKLLWEKYDKEELEYRLEALQFYEKGEFTK